jgi:hypothetical protein
MDTDLRHCWVFFTRGRPPARIQASSQFEACEIFRSQNPDFHLSELLDIREANINRKKSIWLKGTKP